MPKAPYIPPHHNAPNLTALKNFYTQDHPPQYVEPAIIPAQSSLVPNFNIMGRSDYTAIKSIHHISSLNIGESSKQNISSEHKGKPQRPPASAQLLINSIDRYASSYTPISQYAPFILDASFNLINNNASASNFVYNLQRPLLNGYFTRIGITQFQLNWNVPTITSGVNDLILLDISGSPSIFPVQLVQGFYDGFSLANMLQTRILADISGVVPAFTMSYNQQRGSLQYSTGNNAIFMRFGLRAAGDISPIYKAYNTLGLTASNFNTYVNAGFTSTVKFVYTSYIDVISNKLSQYMKVKDSETSWKPDTNVLCRIYTTPPNWIASSDISGNAYGSRPFKLVWDPNTPKMMMWNPNETIFDFDINVVDEFGDLVPWSNGGVLTTNNFKVATAGANFEFQMTLLASET